MDIYRELIWFWYIFEDHTVQQTYELLNSHIIPNPSPDIEQESITLKEKQILVCILSYNWLIIY